MKKTVIATVLVSLFSTSVLATAVSADTLPTTKDTTAKITFGVNPNEPGELVKPNPSKEDPDKQEIIEIANGNKSVGPLRIQFVPSFDFGTSASLSAKEAKAYAKPLAYTTKAGTSTGTQVAPFVQVSDTRGLSDQEFANKNGWTLTVVAGDFIAEAKGGKEAHTLTGATINLNDSKLTTTLGDTALAGTLVSAQKGVIPADANSPLVVLASQAVNTNGYQVSNVFDDSYTKEGVPGATIAGVEFVKPAGVTPQKERDYVSKLEWTLTDGI